MLRPRGRANPLGVLEATRRQWPWFTVFGSGQMRPRTESGVSDGGTVSLQTVHRLIQPKSPVFRSTSKSEYQGCAPELASYFFEFFCVDTRMMRGIGPGVAGTASNACSLN